MNRLLALLLMFSFFAAAITPAPAQDEKKPEVKQDEKKADEPKKEEPKKEDPPKPEPKVEPTTPTAKTTTVIVPIESTWQARAQEVGQWWPLISLALFGTLFFLIIRLRSDLTSLQEKVG